MENNVINIKTVAEIAMALDDLLPRVVFVGGATISLYIDDEAADEIRPTGDIDLTVQLSGFAEWAKLQDRLYELKFSPNPEGHAICNYLYNGISVDIMPAEDSVIGKANRWYRPGFNHLNEIGVEGKTIKILSAPYFLATKFEAFHDRGNSNYRTSHDFEDIIYVIDNRINIVEEIIRSDTHVKGYITDELTRLLSNEYHEEIIRSQIHPLIVDERYPIFLEKIKAIVSTKKARMNHSGFF